MTRKILIALLLGMSSMLCHANQLLDIYVGEIRILKVSPVERVALGNAGLLSTSILKNGQLLLIGEKKGSTSMHLWFANGSEKDMTVRIDEANISQDRAEVAQLLSGVPGLKIGIVGQRVVLTGDVDTTYQPVIETVMGAYKGVLDLTRKDNLALPDKKMVLMNIKITEFNKNYLEDLGIDWGNSIAGPSAAFAIDATNNNNFRVGAKATEPSLSGLPTRVSGALGFFGIAAEISSRINFAVDSGNALILAEPRLVARSGGEASFLAGGEVPLPQSNVNGQSVEYKEFGISLTIKPIIDQNDNISANVSTEVSAVDPSVAVDDIPGFLTRKTSADIYLKAEDTLVISGLLNQQASKGDSRIKYLGDIPVLGALFKSKSFRDNKSELVIFVTPSVHNAGARLNQEYLQRREAGVRDFLETVDEGSLQIID